MSEPNVGELARMTRAVTDAVGANIVIGEPVCDGVIVYAPVTSVDSVGVLLDRQRDHVRVLGSAVALETYVWAYARGVRLHQANTLVVTKVRDLDGAIALFKTAYPPRYVRDEVAPLLARVPAVFALDWPASALLLEPLRHTDVLDYEVNPS